ncbi:snRNA-activating protein complex subunit 1-like [Syngnathoides biaculeatus]|uniref:snRNA-activating protein complex subunit 1-like n=1 Tax=Syngnathoides biaculeatus TaxID=300417 RepID=UPI002ADE44EB|nr:snRNA-activating protein complex subunit 1-like [Syngnathoides biaculeatus]
MPRVPCVKADTFYEPLTEDVEALLGRFQQTDSIRLERFTALWRDARFSDVFLGLPGKSEMRRFCRVSLATAVKYFLPPYCYQVRVGGLYLMHAFYHTQLAVPPVRIRLSLRDRDDVEKFLRDSAAYGHLDVLYVYRKLLSVKAVDFTAMPHSLVFQRPKKDASQKVSAAMLARTTAVKELLADDYLEEVANVHSHYRKMKNDLAEVRLQATMTHADFASLLKDTLSEFLSWQQQMFNPTKDTGKDHQEELTGGDACRSRATLLASIKKRGYEQDQGGSKPKRRRQEAPSAVDPSGSGPEQRGPSKPGRPLSLKARTLRTLGRNSEMQACLQSAHDLEVVPVGWKKQ